MQLLGILLQNDLHIVNCHASTETSDLLGGLRPLRGRNTILNEFIKKAKSFIDTFPLSNDLPIPSFLTESDPTTLSLPPDAVQVTLCVVRKMLASFQKQCDVMNEETNSGHLRKRRKLEGANCQNLVTDFKQTYSYEELSNVTKEIESLSNQYHSLFEWSDGPLVTAMKLGNLILLDEMSLAEDAVLERLNSVLEPSRSLVLAEKGGTEGDEADFKNTIIVAQDNFRIFATMNPGGDFGKRELSPALRSRFTEIWVPSVSDREDIDLVLEHSLSLAIKRKLAESHPLQKNVNQVHQLMLDYVEWFNKKACGNSSLISADSTLSLRDVLAWARFIVDVSTKYPKIDVWICYIHGAFLMHLDGLGLGTASSQTDVSNIKRKAHDFLKKQVFEVCPSNQREIIIEKTDLAQNSYIQTDETFGIEPFYIPVGREEIPHDLKFELKAPTTWFNLRRVLRAMQISKPILLEGSPGVGKTRYVPISQKLIIIIIII